MKKIYFIIIYLILISNLYAVEIQILSDDPGIGKKIVLLDFGIS